MSCHARRKEEPPFTHGRFDSLARCHHEGLPVQEGGLASRKSALEAIDSLKDLVVSRSKLGKVFRSEGPRLTPVQQVLITSAFSIRTLRLRGAVVLWYNSGPNRSRHARMRRIRHPILSEGSAFSRIMLPRYKNWVVGLYLWPPASMTSGGAEVVWCGVS